MMTVKTFEERLTKIKEQYIMINDKNKEIIKGLSSFFEDVYMIPTSWIFNILEDEFINLGLAINSNVNIEELKDLYSYYAYEMEFGDGNLSGSITMKSGKTYHLKKVNELYDYIKEELC